MITFKHKGDFGKTSSFLRSLVNDPFSDANLEKYAELGLKALRENTPTRTGLTADSWGYEITKTKDSVTITWTNSNVKKGYANVALLLQYGHATRNGGYVQGIDYINPAMRPIFDKIAKDAWKEVTITK